MKRIALLLGLVICASHLSAQSDPREFKFATHSEVKRPLQLGASVAADVHFLRGGNNGLNHQEFPPQPGFSVNAWASLPLAQKFSLQFGIGYGYRPHLLINDSIILSSDIDPQLGVVSASRLHYQLTHHDLQVPVLAMFHPQGREKGVFFGLGALTGITISMHSSGEVVQGNGTVEQLDFQETPGSVFLAAQGCAGYRLPLASGDGLGLELVGNAHAFELRNYPARPFSTSVRASYWF